MNWPADRTGTEFPWLILMATMKYDSYQDFLAGARFIENLVVWLQQFDPNERECAYTFLKEKLVFISLPELRHLVELFFPDVVQRDIAADVSSALGIPRYLVWSDPEGSKLYNKLLRKTLFVELSDGARIDLFRRSNAGIISNEQVVTAPRISPEKWDDMLKDLRDDLKMAEERFSRVYLMDDFTGSGKTLVRWDEEKQAWKGKLHSFWTDVQTYKVLEKHLELDWKLGVHHYIATQEAVDGISSRSSKMASTTTWRKDVSYTFGTILPPEMKFTFETLGEFGKLVEKYYDKSIETKHTRVGGDNAKLGFGDCGLPLVLEHNTPNNSLALIWAESIGKSGQHAMRPLFRRRQRHV